MKARFATAKDQESGQIGRREQNKRDKLQRIKAAAYDLFRHQGFDATTIRQIAERAEVGLGTVFSYAADKSELFFLVFNEHNDQLQREAFAGISTQLPLIDQLTAVFKYFLVYLQRDLTFSRALIQELPVSLKNNRGLGAKMHAEREAVIDKLESLIRDAVAAGRVRSDVDTRATAQLIFAVYRATTHDWILEDRPDLEEGLGRLGDVFRILVRGIGTEDDRR